MRGLRLLKYIMLVVTAGMTVVILINNLWVNHKYGHFSISKFRSPSVDESSQTITDSQLNNRHSEKLTNSLYQDEISRAQSGAHVRDLTKHNRTDNLTSNNETLQKTADSSNSSDMATTRSTFRDSFLLWNKARQNIAETIYPYSSDKASRYLIYRCDSGRMSHCGGLGDRIKGMIAGYIIANITDRQFRAEILNPNCDLHQYIIPNLVNWSLSTSFHQSLDKIASDTKIVDLMNNKTIHDNISNINFTELIGSSKYVYFKTNLDYSQGFRHSHLHRDKLSWMEQVTPDQIQATIFKRLLSLSPRLQSRLQNLLAQELPTSKHKLVCAHVRMGRNPSLPTDTDVRLTSEYLPNVWKFIKHHSTSDFHKVFVMSDSAEVMNQSRLQEFVARLVLTPGVIGHVDIPANLNTEDMCSATEKVIFDLHLLMNCDVLMISRSGLGRLAAYVRGSDEGLYCLLKESNGIHPCKTIHIKGMHNALG